MEVAKKTLLVRVYQLSNKLLKTTIIKRRYTYYHDTSNNTKKEV